MEEGFWGPMQPKKLRRVFDKQFEVQLKKKFLSWKSTLRALSCAIRRFRSIDRATGVSLLSFWVRAYRNTRMPGYLGQEIDDQCTNCTGEATTRYRHVFHRKTLIKWIRSVSRRLTLKRKDVIQQSLETYEEM